MVTKRQAGVTGRAGRAPEYDNPSAVASHLASLPHPAKSMVEAIRTAILSADARITEGIKWNSASFYRCGWFATVRDNAKVGVQVVFHHGAKVRADATLGQSIHDPSGLLTWASTDRATVSFANREEFEGHCEAFVRLVRQWASYQAQLVEDTESGAATS